MKAGMSTSTRFGRWMVLPRFPRSTPAHTLLGTAGLVFLSIAVLAAVLAGIIGFYMATSRLLYSMAKEGVLPQWFGRLHSRYKTPANAIVFVMIVSLIAPFFGRTVLGWLVDMASLGAAIGYGYTSAAAFKYAREQHNGGIMATGALGVVFAIIFAVLLLVPISAFGCSLGKESYVSLAVWVVLGAVFFATSRKRS